MSKLIFRLLIFLILITIGVITYLSFIGIETKRFNKQIVKQIKNINDDLEINLNKIKIVLNPIEFKIKAKTIGTSLKIRDKIIEIEAINGEISINSLLNKKFSLTNLEISTKTIEIKKLISFIRILKNDPKRAENYLKERCPLGRFGDVEEIASIVAFYCSKHASFSHGAIIPADAGQARSYLSFNYM